MSAARKLVDDPEIAKAENGTFFKLEYQGKFDDPFKVTKVPNAQEIGLMNGHAPLLGSFPPHEEVPLDVLGLRANLAKAVIVYLVH